MPGLRADPRLLDLGRRRARVYCTKIASVRPDADDKGRRHMEQICRRLRAMGAAPRWLDWPEAPPKGDAADFTAMGGTSEMLAKLIDAAKPYDAPSLNSGALGALGRLDVLGALGQGLVVRLSDVVAEKVKWLWPRRIPLGKLTIIEGDERRALAVTKCNLAPRAPALAYHVEGAPNGSSRVVWGGTIDHTSATLLAVAVADEERGEADAAVDFLIEALAGAEQDAQPIIDQGRRQGFSEKALRRARERLGVTSRKVGFGKDGRWLWSAPAKAPKTPKDAKAPKTPGDRDAGAIGDAALAAISQAGAATVDDVAAACRTDKATVLATVRELASAGLVERCPFPVGGTGLWRLAGRDPRPDDEVE